jgi:hypothetical protein
MRVIDIAVRTYSNCIPSHDHASLGFGNMTARKDEKKLLTRDASIDCTKNRLANEQVKIDRERFFEQVFGRS